MSELDTEPATNKTATTDETLTEYVVLLNDEDAMWRVHTTIKARSSEAAIRSYLDGSANGGTYVAVPSRSWRPVSVTAETQTVLKLEQAT